MADPPDPKLPTQPIGDREVPGGEAEASDRPKRDDAPPVPDTPGAGNQPARSDAEKEPLPSAPGPAEDRKGEPLPADDEATPTAEAPAQGQAAASPASRPDDRSPQPTATEAASFRDRLARAAQGEGAADDAPAPATAPPSTAPADGSRGARAPRRGRRRNAVAARSPPTFAYKRLVLGALIVAAVLVGTALLILRSGVDRPADAVADASPTDAAGADTGELPAPPVVEDADTEINRTDGQPPAPGAQPIAPGPPADRQPSAAGRASDIAPTSGIRVIDGDSFALPAGEVVRVYNIDTPSTGSGAECESEKVLGAKTVARLSELLAECPPVLESRARDSRGRIDTLVEVCGEDLGQVLIREGLATFRGLPVDWCDRSAPNETTERQEGTTP